jgi:hypothetical protein
MAEHTWLTDTNGNKCSAEYWGTKEAAQGALEKFHGALLAGQLIYRESGSPINPCRFFDSNDEALADMKRMAELEAAQ